MYSTCFRDLNACVQDQQETFLISVSCGPRFPQTLRMLSVTVPVESVSYTYLSFTLPSELCHQQLFAFYTLRWWFISSNKFIRSFNDFKTCSSIGTSLVRTEGCVPLKETFQTHSLRCCGCLNTVTRKLTIIICSKTLIMRILVLT
jgi:hypothetical protein